MARRGKAYFDRGIGTNTVAADTDEKQTVPCAGTPGEGVGGAADEPGAAGLRAAAPRARWSPGRRRIATVASGGTPGRPIAFPF